RFIRGAVLVVLQSLADAGDLHLRVRRDLQGALDWPEYRPSWLCRDPVRRLEHQYAVCGMRQSRDDADHREHQLRQTRGISAGNLVMERLGRSAVPSADLNARAPDHRTDREG